MNIKIRTSPRGIRSKRSGATVVEFSIVAPIFLLVLLSSFEFSRLNVIRHTADNAAYEAARHAMVPGATASEATARANTILRTIGARGALVTITPPTLGPDVDSVTVRVEVPLNRNGWVIPRFTGGRILSSESTLRTERAE